MDFDPFIESHQGFAASQLSPCPAAHAPRGTSFRFAFVVGACHEVFRPPANEFALDVRLMALVLHMRVSRDKRH